MGNQVSCFRSQLIAVREAERVGRRIPLFPISISSKFAGIEQRFPLSYEAQKHVPAKRMLHPAMGLLFLAELINFPVAQNSVFIHPLEAREGSVLFLKQNTPGIP